jgi:predicted nucleotidyltransferase
MSSSTPQNLALREVVNARRGEFEVLLAKYHAKNPRLFGSVARGNTHDGSDIDILVEMDPADGNLLMRASGLMEETRQLYARDDIDIFRAQLLKRLISDSALAGAVDL